MSDAAQLTITINQGTVWRRKLVFATGEAENAPRIDLTGCTFRAEIREAWNRDLIAEITIEETDLAAGEIHLQVDDRARAIPAKRYEWDLIITFPDEIPRKYVEGPAIVAKTITRPAAP